MNIKNKNFILIKITTMKSYLFLILCAFALFACQKEDLPTLTEDLAKNNWSKTQILISVDSISDTIPTIEIVSTPCKRDNVWSFDADNNTFTLDEGPSKCVVSDPQIKDQGIIQEQDNGSKLLVDGEGTNEIWEIESRSASSFRVSYFAKNSDNVTVKFRVTFTKI